MVTRLVIQTKEKIPRRWIWWTSSKQTNITITRKKHVCDVCKKEIQVGCPSAHIQVSTFIHSMQAGPLFTGHICENCFEVKKVRVQI